MGALPAQSLALALCSTLAVASRTDSGLTQVASARRGSAGLEANAGALDSASWLDDFDGEDLEENGDDPGVLCVGLLEEVKTKGDKLKLAVLNEGISFSRKRDCEMVCWSLCHGNLTYRIEPWQAQVIGLESFSGPMVASKCESGGQCKCLDAATTTERVNEYMAGEQEHVDIVETEEMRFLQKYGRCNDCMYFGKRRGLLSICVNEWSWQVALYGLSGDGVGLKSAYVQQFKIEVDTGGIRHIQLVGLAGSQYVYCPVKELGRELPESVNLHVAEFSTSLVKVGLADDGEMARWEVRQANSEGQPWMWELLRQGQVAFTVKQQGWAKLKGVVWKVYRGEKRKKDKVYYAYEDGDGGSQGEGFRFRFYRDKQKKTCAGWVLHAGRGKEVTVEVARSDDAGLLLITSALMSAAYDAS